MVEHYGANAAKGKKGFTGLDYLVRLCTFRLNREGAKEQRAGLVEGTKVFEFNGRMTMADVLGSGGGKLPRGEGEGYPFDDVVLGAPVPKPGKIVAAIVNTRGMLGGNDIRLDRPRLDMKAPSTVIGPGETIRAPVSGIRPEVELAVIVGRRLSKDSPSEVRRGLFGYTVLNDVTAPRDLREDSYQAYRRDRDTGGIRKATLRGPLFRSKNHDTFCPMGPWVVTPDENRNWSNLRMTTRFGICWCKTGRLQNTSSVPRGLRRMYPTF
jgi:2-keto-4-pentenoate hydratase/2-oxohepta-3-ene-1,7-dioic acid hydratase in catechol pathway